MLNQIHHRRHLSHLIALQLVDKCRLIDRRGVQIALNILTADGLEKFCLFPSLHALGNDRQTKPAYHSDYSGDDGAASVPSGVIPLGGEEPHIQLDNIEIYILQRTQGRKTAAEVIHCDLIAERMETAYSAAYRVRVAAGGRLRNLKPEILLRNLMALTDFLQLIKEPRHGQIFPGEIDRDWYKPQTVIQAAADKSTDLIQYIEVKTGHKTALLHRLDELTRQNNSPGRRTPADQ